MPIQPLPPSQLPLTRRSSVQRASRASQPSLSPRFAHNPVIIPPHSSPTISVMDSRGAHSSNTLNEYSDFYLPTDSPLLTAIDSSLFGSVSEATKQLEGVEVHRQRHSYQTPLALVDSSTLSPDVQALYQTSIENLDRTFDSIESQWPKLAIALNHACGRDAFTPEDLQNRTKSIISDVVSKLTTLKPGSPLSNTEFQIMIRSALFLIQTTVSHPSDMKDSKITEQIASFDRGQAVIVTANPTEVTLRRIMCTRSGEYDDSDFSPQEQAQVSQYAAGWYFSWVSTSAPNNVDGGGKSRLSTAVREDWTPARNVSVMFDLANTTHPIVGLTGPCAAQDICQNGFPVRNGGAMQFVPLASTRKVLEEMVATSSTDINQQRVQSAAVAGIFRPQDKAVILEAVKGVPIESFSKDLKSLREFSKILASQDPKFFRGLFSSLITVSQGKSASQLSVADYDKAASRFLQKNTQFGSGPIQKQMIIFLLQAMSTPYQTDKPMVLRSLATLLDTPHSQTVVFSSYQALPKITSVLSKALNSSASAMASAGAIDQDLHLPDTMSPESEKAVYRFLTFLDETTKVLLKSTLEDTVTSSNLNRGRQNALPSILSKESSA